MNEAQALAEAKRRWGKDALVNYEADEKPTLRYQVGAVRTWSADIEEELGLSGSYIEYLGSGSSWEDAFAAADTHCSPPGNKLARVK